MSSQFMTTKIEPVRKTLDLLELITPADEPYCYVSIRTAHIELEFAPSDWDAAVELKRTEALAFLGRWARRFAKLGKVDKSYGEYSTSVAVPLVWGITLTATAASDVVCEYVPATDDAGEPIMREEPTYEQIQSGTKLVPVLEKVCPPSFLTGVTI